MSNDNIINPSEIFLQVIKGKAIDSKWADSPHELFKRLPNSSKGDAGEEFLKEFLTKLGFKVEKDGRLGDYDLKIEGKKFEVKTATEDTTGAYQFNHIRYDSKYDFLLCFGVSPQSLGYDIWTKGEVATDIAGTLVSMGKNQNSSYKLTKKVSSLRDLSQIKDHLKSLLKIS